MSNKIPLPHYRWRNGWRIEHLADVERRFEALREPVTALMDLAQAGSRRVTMAAYSLNRSERALKFHTGEGYRYLPTSDGLEWVWATDWAATGIASGWGVVLRNYSFGSWPFGLADGVYRDAKYAPKFTEKAGGNVFWLP